VLMAALIVALLTGPTSAQQQQIDVPGKLQLLIMIKTILIAFNDANATGNYTVLRDLASPEFQQTHTAASLAKIFERERERKVDISPIVVLEPTLLRRAFIDKSGLLWVAGFFSSTPMWVNFRLAFKPILGRWRLEALGVLTGEDKVAISSNQNVQSAVSSDTVQKRGPTVNEIVRTNWPTEAIRASQDYNEYFGFMGRLYLGDFK
jgi:hypothetical protein